MRDGGCKGGTCNKNPDTHIKVWWGGERTGNLHRSICPEIKPEGIKKFVEWQCALNPENKREGGIK